MIQKFKIAWEVLKENPGKVAISIVAIGIIALLGVSNVKLKKQLSEKDKQLDEKEHELDSEKKARENDKKVAEERCRGCYERGKNDQRRHDDARGNK